LQINKAASIIYDLLSVHPWKLELEIKGAAAETAINNNNGNDYLKTHIYIRKSRCRLRTERFIIFFKYFHKNISSNH